MKAVIYARYSSDNQREESIEGRFENVPNTLSEMTLRFFPAMSTAPYPPELLIVPNFKG